MVKRNNFRIVLKRLLLVLNSIMFFFIIMELSFVITGEIKDIDFSFYARELVSSQRHPPQMILNDPFLYHKLHLNYQGLATTSDFSVIYKINSKGLRDKEYKYEKKEDITRVLALGDSLTFGEGIPYGKRFTDIVEEKFDDLEIINAGVPGYGLDQIYLSFISDGYKYNPNYVFIFIKRPVLFRNKTNFIKNSKIVIPNFNSSEINLLTKPFISKGAHLNKPLIEKSNFLSYLYYQFMRIKLSAMFENQDKLIWDYSFSKESNYDYIEERTDLIMTEFNKLAEDMNFTLFIVNIDPYYDLSFLDEYDNFINLYDYLDQYKENNVLSFKYDSHYNPKTNKFIADKLIEEFILFEIAPLI